MKWTERFMSTPKQAPPTIYLIVVRPPGSYVWTFHTEGVHGTVWRRGDPKAASLEAMHIVEHTAYCARVVAVHVPPLPDEQQYALMADGDTRYVPAEPKHV